VAPGAVEIALPFRDNLTQQKASSTAGSSHDRGHRLRLSAYSLMPADSSLVTVEYKIKSSRPPRARWSRAAKWWKAGRTLTVARAEVTLTMASTSPPCSRP